jgi:diguanylate cyclase (GGDEF)-like protein
VKRLVLIGGGREGLETLAHAVRQHEWSVAMVIDPDPGALVFRLGDLGYRFADASAVPLDRRLEAVRDVVPLELAVDATSDRATRRALRQVAPTLDVVGSAAARLLWTLAELPPEERAAQSLKLVKPVTDQIDVSTPGELAWLIAETARLVGDADVARVHRWDDARQRLVPLGARGGPPAVSSTAIRVVRDRRVVAASEADRATAWLLEDDAATAAVAAPIQSDEDLLGLLELRRTERREPFSPAMETWMAEFSSLLVRPLKKMRTIREVREAAQTEATRRDLKALLAGDQPIRATLQRAVDALGAILQAGAVHLYVTDPQNGDVLLQASTAIRVENAGIVRVKSGEGLIGEVAAVNRQIVLREEGASGDPPPGGSARGLVATPLSAGRRAVGVLVVETSTAVEVTLRLLALLTEVGELLGGSIASDAERHQMSQKVIKLSVVNEEGLQLLGITDRDKVLITGTAATAMILDAEAVVLRILDRGGDRLLVAGTYGLHRDEIDAALVKLDQAVAARVAESKTSIRSSRIDDFGVVLPEGFPYHSVLAGPVFADDRLVGTVGAYNKLLYQSFACGSFDADDQEILGKFSFYLGRALVQAQEFRERQALITIDDVTGLKNRRYLDLRLPEEIRRAERFQRKVSLLIMEVTGFDDIGRAFTAQGRDELLRALAGMIRETFRNVDILARLDGARFGVVMPDTGDRTADVLDRLSQAVAAFRLKGPDGRSLKVNLAVGTATFPGDAASVPDLFARAEQLTPLE